jgi:hypothetical protein
MISLTSKSPTKSMLYAEFVCKHEFAAHISTHAYSGNSSSFPAPPNPPNNLYALVLYTPHRTVFNKETPQLVCGFSICGAPGGNL